MQSRSCAQKSGAGYFFNRIYQIIVLLHKAIPIYKREGWDGNRTDRRPKHAMDECVLMGGGRENQKEGQWSQVQYGVNKGPREVQLYQVT